jgi:hypothetical protein
MSGDFPTDWRDLREFAAVDLSRSFVLSWDVHSDAFLIDVDVLLLPEHPFYETPRPKEKVCIRPAVIEFPFCQRVSTDGVSAGTKPAAAVKQLKNGAISGLRRVSDGRYEISGTFGAVLIEAERPILRLKGP